MLDILAGFDILGVGTLIGSLLFLGGLVWLLVDNRSFDEVSRRHAAEVERKLPVERKLSAPTLRDANVPMAAPPAAATATTAARAAARAAAPDTAPAEGAGRGSRSTRAPRTGDVGSGRPSHPERVA